MAKSLKALLNKSSWTGEEVGKALLMNLAQDIDNARQGKDLEPLLSDYDMKRMVHSLNTDSQINRYRVYSKIYDIVLLSSNQNQAFAQQFLNGFYRSFYILQEANRAEHAIKETYNYPLIMTQKEYDSACKKITEKKSHEKERYQDLFFMLLDHYLDAYDNSDSKEKLPASITKALEHCEKEIVSDKKVLSNYCELYSLGYHETTDGIRSDKISEEEWTKLLDSRNENYAQALALQRFLFEGPDKVREAYKDKTGKELKATDSEIISALEISNSTIQVNPEKAVIGLSEIIEKIVCPDNLQTTWHQYEEPQEPTSKYDLISSGTDIGDILTDLYNVKETQELSTFKKEYPELSKVISEQLSKLLPGIKPDSSYTWKQLSDNNFLDYSERIKIDPADIGELFPEDTTEAREKRYRASHRGVAIIQDTRDIDSKGNYKQKDTYSMTYWLQSIDKLEEDQGSIELINTLYSLLTQALAFISANNALLTILFEVFGIDFLGNALTDTSGMINQIEAYNGFLFAFYAHVSGGEKERQEKREKIKRLFRPIDLATVQPSEKEIEEVRSIIEEVGAGSKAYDTLKNYEVLLKKLLNNEAQA
jgi:hypothetical protein